MPSFVRDFFDSADFMPHGFCFLWQPAILWLHVASDAAIAAAYFAIPLVLFHVLRKRQDLPFENIFLLFAAFILFCGMTHAMSIWVLWHPAYAVEGLLKAFTALASVSTLFVTIRMVPRIVGLPGPGLLSETNRKLQAAYDALDLAYRQDRASATSDLRQSEADLKQSRADLEQSESDLERSEERYDLALRGMSVGLWDWDIVNNSIYWSEKFRNYLGVIDDRFTPDLEYFVERLHPEDKDIVLASLNNHLQQRGPYNIEHRLRREDGTYIWLNASGQAKWNAEGKPVRMVGSVADITNRKANELQIRENAARMTAVMNTVLDGLVTIDGHGIMQTFNPAATHIFGYEPDEVIGQNVKMLMPEPHHSEHDGHLGNYMKTGKSRIVGITREVSAKHKGGNIIPIELAMNEMQVSGQRMFVGTMRDISHRKQAEQEILQFVEQLRRSNQELDDFAHIASHDLKEPLRGLSNNAQFLMEDLGNDLGETEVKRLNRMIYLCGRMERLVNDLLYFSRLGRQEMAVQPTDLNDVIRDIESTLEATLHEKNTTLIVPEKLPVVVCDLPRITEVFRNLISNAIKYNDKQERRIEIGCKTQNGERVFYVRDNGIGIAKQFHDDVFRIFKRLNVEDDSVKGTGVGLTFVKKIIERHRGRIWIESEVGCGTVFYFTIKEAKES